MFSSRALASENLYAYSLNSLNGVVNYYGFISSTEHIL